MGKLPEQCVLREEEAWQSERARYFGAFAWDADS